MYEENNGSIAALGYRDLPAMDFHDVVHRIDTALQSTDMQDRRLIWASDQIAMIDRDGMRIALGWLPSHDGDPYSHLVIAVGRIPGRGPYQDMDDLGVVPFIHLADRLVLRIKDFMPFDTILRGESPEAMDTDLIESVFDLLRKCPAEETGAAAPAAKNRSAAVDVIDPEDLPLDPFHFNEWMENRADPTPPLRLTVHTIALSVMLYTPPLGAFLFTYSMLRDLSSSPA